MSNAIMSRFDLFFIVTDDCSEVSDYNIARHIVMNRVRDVCSSLARTYNLIISGVKNAAHA
jgi:DNA replicative helicase MCM subunit Mcm2 (Cdc46/Mcm family)